MGADVFLEELVFHALGTNGDLVIRYAGWIRMFLQTALHHLCHSTSMGYPWGILVRSVTTPSELREEILALSRARAEGRDL
jgi:hypothetical protein